MKISAHILYRNLSEVFPFEIVGSVGSELVLERPLFYCNDIDMLDNRIYIMDAALTSELPASATKSVLLYVGCLPDGLADHFETTFVFQKGLSVFSLHNEVQAIYSQHEQWHLELQNILNSGGDIQEMIDCSAFVFRNPILLHNKDFDMIAFSSDYSDNPSFQPLLDKDNLKTFKNAFWSDAEYEETFTTRTPSIFPAHITGARSLYLNMFFQGRYMYRLILIEFSRELLPSDGPQLELLASYMQLAINANWANTMTEGFTLQHVMKSILSGEFTDPYFIEKKLAEYRWKKQHSYMCIKVMADKPNARNQSLNLICDHIMDMLPGSCAFEFEGYIAVYINLDLSEVASENIASRFASYFRDNFLKAGISNKFSDYNEWRLFYRQADIALNVGLHNRPHIWIHQFRDIVELFMLESCTNLLPASMVCAPEIIELKSYDKEHGTEYCRTLMTYLKNNLRHVQTAKELFIHRSTFLYRLDRIREITGIDTENYSRQWYLLLSFKLLELIDQKES